jgi:hypothetical protein
MARKRRLAGGLGWRRNRGQRGEEAEEEERKWRSISWTGDLKVFENFRGGLRNGRESGGRSGEWCHVYAPEWCYVAGCGPV